jgi:hypothetical protein
VKPVVEEAELKSLASAYGTCDSLQNGTWTAKGRSKLLGIDVTEVEVERTGREVITAWVAPELQRFALKRTDILDGELRVREEVLSVRNAEPPASMFAQPDGYALVSPREMEDRYLEREYQRAIGLSKLEQN